MALLNPCKKIILVGESGVGKSALVGCWLTGEFFAEYDPTILDEYRDRKGFEMVDTSGDNALADFTERYLVPNAIYVLVFAITSKSSLDWACSFRPNLPGRVILVGNKSDEPRRKVSKEDAQTTAKSLRCRSYFEVTATVKAQVDELFQTVLDLFEERDLSEQEDISTETRQSVGRKRSIGDYLHILSARSARLLQCLADTGIEYISKWRARLVSISRRRRPRAERSGIRRRGSMEPLLKKHVLNTTV